MEGGYQILNLGKVNLTSTSRLVPGAYDYITKNLQHKTVLLEGLRLDGKDYDAIFTTFAKSSDNYIGNFVIDSRIYSLIVRPSNMCNTKRLVPVGDDIIEMTEAMIAEPWDSSEVYGVGAYVTYNHVLYVALATTTGETPSTHPGSWSRSSVTSQGASNWVEIGRATGNNAVSITGNYNEINVLIISSNSNYDRFSESFVFDLLPDGTSTRAYVTPISGIKINASKGSIFASGSVATLIVSGS